MTDWPAETVKVLSEASGHTVEDTKLVLKGLCERGYILVPKYAVDNLPPIHAGQLLKKDLETLNMTVEHFADLIGVPPDAVIEVLNGDPITEEMAIRLSVFFHTSAQYWHNLQAIYDAKRKIR